MHRYIELSPKVERALKTKTPILALESTLITHGLPYPHNIETARTLELIAENEGVTPATIAIIKGKINIGLTSEQLEMLVEDHNVAKASVRDVPAMLAKGLTAGTTVAATLFCADYVGIKQFATGGIGGVHRGDSQDISADLIQLSKCPIAVIASGAKAILDIPKTLEFLETLSVPVIGYGTDTFPAFYTAKSSYPLTQRVDNISTLAKLLAIHWQLNLSSGILIANPIPSAYEIPMEDIEPTIHAALRQAEEKGITGKDITPFLLNEIAHATEGKSMDANIHLIKNNVKLGALLASMSDSF